MADLKTKKSQLTAQKEGLARMKETYEKVNIITMTVYSFVPLLKDTHTLTRAPFLVRLGPVRVPVLGVVLSS